MRILWLLVVATSISAWAQTPQELLRLAQQAYKNPAGYDITGRGSVQLAGSSWQVTFFVEVIGTPAPLETPNAPAVPASRVGGPMQWTNIGGGTDAKPQDLTIPGVVTDVQNGIAQNVSSVSEIGTEQLPLNGSAVDCRILEVQYNATASEAIPAPVQYSICSEKNLVLKKVMFYSTGRNPTDPGATWTVTFDTAQFDHPGSSRPLDPIH